MPKGYLRWEAEVKVTLFDSGGIKERHWTVQLWGDGEKWAEIWSFSVPPFNLDHMLKTVSIPWAQVEGLIKLLFLD